MPRTRTLAQLRAEVRDRGDLSPPRHSSDSIDRDINQSIQDLEDMIRNENPDYKISVKYYDIVADTDSYALPDDYTTVMYVDVKGNQSRWLNVIRAGLSERNRYQVSTANKYTMAYHLQNDRIRFFPTPNFSGSVRVWYTPVIADLAGDASGYDGVAGWEEFVVLDTIIKRKIRDEERVDELFLERQRSEKKIKNSARDRNDGQPKKIRDTTKERFLNRPIPYYEE